MPRQNRVTPTGDLIAVPARGTLMGNRGCLHDDQGRIRRHSRGRRWIYCRLEFRGRRRVVMTPGRYTELFFLDEATALAAGHRPCAECLRSRFALFRTHWAAANRSISAPHTLSASEIDHLLHEERQAHVGRQEGVLGDVPAGAFVLPVGEDVPCLVTEKGLCLWTPGGYLPRPATSADRMMVLTPPSVVRLLTQGYPCAVHPSAFGAQPR